MQAPLAADMRFSAILPLASTTNNTRAPAQQHQPHGQHRSVSKTVQTKLKPKALLHANSIPALLFSACTVGTIKSVLWRLRPHAKQAEHVTAEGSAKGRQPHLLCVPAFCCACLASQRTHAAAPDPCRWLPGGGSAGGKHSTQRSAFIRRLYTRSSYRLCA